MSHITVIKNKYVDTRGGNYVKQSKKVDASKKKYYIQSLMNGMVLDIKFNDKTSGRDVILFEKNGQENQLWYFVDDMLKSVGNDALVLDSDENNGKIIVAYAHGRPNQKWRFNSDNTLQSFTGKVLDVKGGGNVLGRAWGHTLIPFDKHGGRNQQFKLVEK